LKLSSFKSIVGTTWVVSEGYCVLGYFKSKAAATRELRERRKHARKVAEARSIETDEIRKKRELEQIEQERRDARADPRQMSFDEL
jgi:hypothetical protein